MSAETFQQLKEAEARYRGIFENAVEGIYQSTPDGRYQMVNIALARMYGYERTDELLNQVSDIQRQVYVDPTMRERFREEIDRTGFIYGLEYQVRRCDGKVIWISESARAVRDEHGTVRCYEGFIDDITPRKEAEAAHARLEKQMLHTQKLEAIGTLAGGIAHDFNNVLCAILGYTQLALMDQNVKGLARENLQAVLKSTDRAKDLVKRILTFSRRSEPERRPVKLGPILKDCVKLLNATLPSTIEITLTFETEEDAVVADVTEIHQIITNLGTNASHAMRAKGGKLEYNLAALDLTAAETVALAPLKPGPSVCLTVRDNGHGMSRAVMENIFDPFFTTKPVGQGTGLGLTLVHKIITGSGGCITVESQEGVGTTFRIYLPCVAQGAVPVIAGEKQILPGKRERLLIVDDELPVLSMMQQHLRMMGYRVITRADSVDALETFRSEPEKYDLVITDHTMPVLPGADLAEKLGEIRADVPVILMTGLNQPPSFNGSRYAPLRAVVQKPIEFVEFSHRLRGFLDRQNKQTLPVT